MGGVGKSCMSRVGGGGEQKKVSQKQHAKSGPEAAWQKVIQNQPAKIYPSEAHNIWWDDQKLPQKWSYYTTSLSFSISAFCTNISQTSLRG